MGYRREFEISWNIQTKLTLEIFAFLNSRTSLKYLVGHRQPRPKGNHMQTTRPSRTTDLPVGNTRWLVANGHQHSTPEGCGKDLVEYKQTTVCFQPFFPPRPAFKGQETLIPVGWHVPSACGEQSPRWGHEGCKSRTSASSR